MTQQQDTNVGQTQLSATRVDGVVIAARGVLGAIPIVGPLVAEIVGAVIPNQRMDRIAHLVSALAVKVGHLEHGVLEQRLSTPLGVDLLEDAFQQAARAVSEERIEYIAKVLAVGISEDEAKIGDKKFLMWLLGQLSDAEVILLAWFNMSPTKDEDFRKRHWNILEPKAAHMGSSQDEIDDWTLYESRKAHLVSLDLLRRRFRPTSRHEVPEFDEQTGMLKASGHDVTALGRLLMRTIEPR